MKTMDVHPVVLLLLVQVVESVYDCVCHYSTDTDVFERPSNASNVFGSLQMYDCKPTQLVPDVTSGFIAIQFNGQVGYIKNDTTTQVQLCAGNPTTTDIVPNTTTTMSTTTVFQTTRLTNKPTTSTGSADCPNGWTLHGASCYFFSTDHNDLRTWSESQRFCQANGGHLLDLRSHAHSNFILQHIRNDAAQIYVWVGQIDHQSRRESLTFHTSLDVQSRSQQSRSVHINTFCVAIDYHDNHLHYGNCEHAYGFTCELPFLGARLTTTQPPTCERGSVHFEGSCYMFHIGSGVNWYTASDHCRRDNSHLVFVETDREHEFLRNVLMTLMKNDHQNTRLSAWIGSTCPGTVHDYVWRQGSPGHYEDKQMTVTQWDSHEPDEHSNGYCVYMYDSKNFAWHDHQCTGHYNYICEREIHSPPLGG